MILKADERVPVLIAGGSLVGLSASLFLARLGVDHLLVEQHADTSDHPRGRGNNLRTMEIFRTAGVEQDIREGETVAFVMDLVDGPNLRQMMVPLEGPSQGYHQGNSRVL